MAWPVESLPSHPATRVRFPAGSGISIPILGLDVCPLPVFGPVSGGGPDIVLSIQGGPPLCICLLFRSIDNCSPYSHLTHGHLSCMSRGASPKLEEGKYKKKERNKERKKKRKKELNRNLLENSFISLICYLTLTMFPNSYFHLFLADDHGRVGNQEKLNTA